MRYPLLSSLTCPLIGIHEINKIKKNTFTLILLGKGGQLSNKTLYFSLLVCLARQM